MSNLIAANSRTLAVSRLVLAAGMIALSLNTPATAQSNAGRDQPTVVANVQDTASRLAALERQVEELASQSQRRDVDARGFPEDARSWLEQYWEEQARHGN